MSITRQQLADDLRTLWINAYDPEAPKQECSDNRWLAVADAAVLALDAADKIARELPEGWFGESTPRPGRGWVVVAYKEGITAPVYVFNPNEWYWTWQWWRPIVLPAHPHPDGTP